MFMKVLTKIEIEVCVCVYLFKVLVAMQVTVSVPMTTRSKDIWLLSTYLVISENKYLAAKYLTFE